MFTFRIKTNLSLGFFSSTHRTLDFVFSVNTFTIHSYIVIFYEWIFVFSIMIAQDGCSLLITFIFVWFFNMEQMTGFAWYSFDVEIETIGSTLVTSISQSDGLFFGFFLFHSQHHTVQYISRALLSSTDHFKLFFSQHKTQKKEFLFSGVGDVTKKCSCIKKIFTYFTQKSVAATNISNCDYYFFS